MDQKLENVLNLALETSEEERLRTEDLNVGYDGETRSWELIVKYSGSLDELEKMGVGVEELIAGYAILTVPEQLVEAVSRLEQIEYVEKPKRYYYAEGMLPEGAGFAGGALATAAGFAEGVLPAEQSCIADVMYGAPGLTGAGTLIAVLDSGIDWRRDEFRRADGSTRIRFFWDQSLRGQPPEGFRIGREFTEQQINEALMAKDEQERFALLPSLDVSGHGTAVAGIAAGALPGNTSGALPGNITGALPGNAYLGAAPRAELLVVKLGTPDALGFPRTTEIMRAVTWALRKAAGLRMPLAVNLSFGNCYGPHNGSSLLERFLDNAAEIGRTVICVGSGNEGASGGHAAGSVRTAEHQNGAMSQNRPALSSTAARRTTVELAVGEYERSLRVQLWQDYSDVYRVFLRSPGGRESELTAPTGGGKFALTLEQTSILAYQGEPLPYAAAKELYFELLPTETPYINSGVWQIILDPVRVVTGQFFLYLPDSASRNGRTQFYRPTPQATLTVPSAAAKVITVGACDPVYDSYADFSGRGYAGSGTGGVASAPAVSGAVKPDLVAPGVNILAPDTYGGYLPVTGTSFATPIVTGACALLMEWGIARGNDPFLYGEKLKAYLRKGAQPLRGETEYPNERVGADDIIVSS